MWTESAIALLGLAVPPGTLLNVLTDGHTIYGKRNDIVASFLARPELAWLFFCDSDMAPPADALLRLLGWDMPIVAGLCFARRPHHHPCAGFETPEGHMRPLESGVGAEPLREVDWAGTGALLIKRSVLEALPAPWFLDGRPGEGGREDVQFCRRARAAGFPIFVDTSLEVGHVGATVIDAAYSNAWNLSRPGTAEG